MKRLCLFVVLGLMLCGCGAEPVMETLGDAYVQPVSADVGQVLLELPQEAATPTLESTAGGKLYLCGDYEITVQTVAAGDLDKTLKNATGFSREQLTVMETVSSGIKRYECAWSAVGEGTDQVGRAVVLDDGAYHYVLTVMAAAENTGSLAQTWDGILGSFRLATGEYALNTGS